MTSSTTARRVWSGVAATAATLALVASGSVAATAAPTDTTDSTDSGTGISSFVLPVLPDTQFYSRYSASQFFPQYSTDPFEVQAEWIVENQDELNMPFTVHVGDVVDQQWVTAEWDAAERAMDVLTTGGMPYSVLPGNHDVENQGARSSSGNADNYRGRFGASALAAQADATGATLLGTHQDGLSSAYLFEAEGHQWMSLAIAWNASDDTFTWAQGVLDAHPNVPVILSSHAIISIADDQLSPSSWWWGDLLWDRLINNNDQIILTLNGHFHGATMRERTNAAGNPVYQVLTDYQMAADGGNGIMSLFEFDLTNNRIDVETISPWVSVKDEGSRSSSDTPVLEGTWQSFHLDLHFGDRFGWTIDPQHEDGGDLSTLATQIVSEGWDGGAGGATQAAAGSADDYIAVEGTIAHWRFGTTPEGNVDEHTVIPDIAGASPMYRNPLAATDEDDAAEDVSITHTNVPYYSADVGAVCFDNVHRNDSGRDSLAYITTEYGAPATFADLDRETGYTIETFLQLDEDWTEAANRWGAALTRGGAREWIGINDGADPGAGASWIGISSLREYQFSAGDTSTSNSYTLWSGEIMQGAWHHVAIVNDPETLAATMYVDGVPVLRNASNVGGMMAADFMPWIIGTSTWHTEPDHGWYGCVGETRIVDHALRTDEFLTERVDIDTAFTVTTDFGKVYAPGASLQVVEGAGEPGSTVQVTHDDTVIAQATVSDAGSWSATLDTPITGPGAYAVSAAPWIGTREGVAVESTFVIGTVSEWQPSEETLDEGTQGAITVSDAEVTAGDTVVIRIAPGHEGEQVYAFVFSTPTSLGVHTVSAASTISVTIPSGLAPGTHRLAAYAADGTLLGWTEITIADAAASSGGETAGAEGSAQGGTHAATGGTTTSALIAGALAVVAILGGGILLAVRLRRREV